jgi:membrane peptidoglycan carboxypeptidase
VLGTNEIAPLTMATAFAAIANDGIVCEPIVVDRFVTASGQEIPGQTPSCRQGITPDVAAAAATPMRSVITGGTGTRANPGGDVPVIGKTGTTDSQVQTWMVGSSTNVATAVWVGNVVGDYRLSRYRNGTVLRHDIFRVIMQTANEQYGGEAFPAAPDRLMQGSGITLPDIAGLTTDEATILLESLGLKLEVTTGIVGGRVGAFEPVAGTLLARGMIVRVVSAGSGEALGNLVMPNLVGLSVSAANQAMDGARMTGPRAFTCVAGSPGSDPSQGVVTEHAPGSGAQIWSYAGLQIQVSCGTEPAPTDDLFLD